MNEIINADGGNAILDIILNGVSETALLNLTTTISLISISIGILTILKQIVAKWILCISNKSKINSFIVIERKGGQLLTVKILKIGYLTTSLLNVETGNEIIMKNTEFADITKENITCEPLNIKKDYIHKTINDF